MSVHLHSFTAKVMKIRNPKRKYMLFPPLHLMLEILVKKLPKNSIFIGDNLYQETLEQTYKNLNILLSNNSFNPRPHCFFVLNDKLLNYDDKRAFVKLFSKDKNKGKQFIKDKYDERIRLLKTNPPLIKLTKPLYI